MICLMPCNDESRHRSMVVRANARKKQFWRTSCIPLGTWKFMWDRRRCDFLWRNIADSDDGGLFVAALGTPVVNDILFLFLFLKRKFKAGKKLSLTFFKLCHQAHEMHSCLSILIELLLHFCSSLVRLCCQLTWWIFNATNSVA